MNEQQLASMTNQQINILVADKLGLCWSIRPEDNEDDPWAWKFSDSDWDARVHLPDYCGGVTEVTKLMTDYGIGVRVNPIVGYPAKWCSEYKGDLECPNDNPWRSVCDTFLTCVEVV